MALPAQARTLEKVAKGQPLPADRFVELAKLVNPAVVNISTTSMPKRQNPRRRHQDPFFDLFEQFANPYYGRPQRPAQSLGTGFIIKSSGLIITNNHVVEKADVIKVQLDENSKESYEAEVIGRDPKTDIALIKIDAKKKLPVIEFGSSQDLEVGEWVAAFGNPYGHGHTMTKGIISAIGREIDELNLFPFLQTDASINPGNSGGPLVNLQGQVIGVNTAIDARAQGIGFAIPIDNVKSILKELESKGKVERGYIGIYMTDIDERAAKELDLKSSDGALVAQVMADSPAEKAGLQPYDLIYEVAGKKVENTRDLSTAVAATPVGKKVKVKVFREGKKKTLNVKVGKHPESQSVATRGNKTYSGQKAPFELGFRIEDWSSQLQSEFELPPLKSKHPIVTDVMRGSTAARSGLAPGDVVLDVNRKKVKSAKDLIRRLKKGNNVIRVLKQDRVAILYLQSEE
ncbi:MAG: Do family serine endopeptidase [Bdellovibrionales bacterium]|nr:Do family serine endopeptidase [Bdellovibrionales bacterium]